MTRAERPGPRPGPLVTALPDLPPELPARPGPRPGPLVAVAAPLAPKPRRIGVPHVRGRHLVRGGAVASIAAGVCVFVAASSVAGQPDAAPARHPSAPGAAGTPGFGPFIDTVPPGGGAAGSGVADASKTAPRKHPKAAPADPAAISGLAANGIPSVALNAYRVAAARIDNVEPGCGIDWSLLAGIGRVESDHGRFHGAVLHTDGLSTPRIIGPALDGKHWDYIPAPGNGLELDGDAKYAHALGPMQFIPSTWAIYGADETGDGRADIFNINDAALGTARYLCAAGGDLRTAAGRVRAVLTYNHSNLYLAQADAYRRGIPVTGIPLVGNLNGTLPTVTNTGYVPPANPGAPTATGGGSHKPKPKPKPKPSTSPSSTAPHPSGSTTSRTSPPPTTTGTPKPSGSSSQPSPSPTGTSSSPVCTGLRHLLHQC